ncbi:MAG: inorganic diphosphatase [Ktedonobacterales bacterium]
MDETFWQTFDALIASSEIVIDRPRGSTHPRYPEIIYPLDYGYLDGTRCGDGDGIDVWLGSRNSAGERRLIGVIVTVDPVKRDSEIKLLNCTTDEVTLALATHRSNQQQALLVRRDCER